MFQDLLGYEVSFTGSSLISLVLGSAVFFYGGWPFLAGAFTELRARRPGMMLLIGMAITVAWGASLAASIGWFDGSNRTDPPDKMFNRRPQAAFRSDTSAWQISPGTSGAPRCGS